MGKIILISLCSTVLGFIGFMMSLAGALKAYNVPDFFLNVDVIIGEGVCMILGAIVLGLAIRFRSPSS